MKRWLRSLICCLILIVSATGTVHAEDEIQLYAQSAVLMDGDSGRILLSKNGQEIRPMASTTKIMTCIIALEYAKFDDMVEFSSEAVSQPKVHLGAKKGEKFLLRDLLYSLMLESHNDTAVAVAETVGGSVHDFTELMNAKAKSIGCEQTHFVTPNGLDASDLGGIHSTTAEELARIMRYCLFESDKRKEFIHITRMANYSFSNIEGSKTYSCYNHNAFLNMMAGALSGKTGFTGDAGYCYVGALKEDERKFIVALLGCGWPNHKSYKWSDTKKLMQYALDEYAYENVPYPKLKDINVENGLNQNRNCFQPAKVSLTYEKSTDSIRLLKNKKEKVQTNLNMNHQIQAPIQEGTVVGTYEVHIGTEPIISTNIIAKDTVEEWNYQDCLRTICVIFTKMIK